MRMSAAATEYVRGIPVVKVFQQTVLSFRAFHEAIIGYRDMATNYTEYCRRPQVVQLVAINSTSRCSYLRVLRLRPSHLISRLS